MDGPQHPLIERAFNRCGVVAFVVVDQRQALRQIFRFDQLPAHPPRPVDQRWVARGQMEQLALPPPGLPGAHPPQQVAVGPPLAEGAVGEDPVHRGQDRMRLLVGQRADALFEAIEAPKRSPLDPWIWVVPHASVGRWLRARAVARDGVAANWRIRTPWQFWAEQVAASTGLPLVGRRPWEAELCSHLLRSPPPSLAPYLDRAASEAERELRAHQLATRLVRWALGTRAHGGRNPEGELAAWVDGIREASGWVHLDEVSHRWVPPPGPVVFWDTVGAAPSLWQAVERLPGSVTVVSTNPCIEFWEDLPPRRRARRPPPQLPSRSTPLLFPSVEENPLLVQWGAAGRPVMAAVHRAGEGDLDAAFVEPDDTHGLGRLQADILFRRAPRPGTSDQSLRWVEAASPRNEARAMIETLKAHPDTPLDRVAVSLAGQTPDPALRAAVVAALEQASIPFAEIDVPTPSREGPFGLFRQLVELPGSGFGGARLTELLEHPNLAVALDPEERQVVTGWLRALPVVDGADRKDHRGSYLEGDVLNWEQGIRRLALGLLWPHGVAVSVGERAYRAHGPGSTELAGRALGELRALFRDLARLRTPLSPHDWKTVLQSLIARWIRPEREDDERDLVRLHDVIEDLQGTQGAWSHRLLARWVGSALDGLRHVRGPAWAHGVTVGPLGPTSGCTVELRFVLGLDDATFPRRDGAADWSPEGPPSAEDADRFDFLRAVMNTTGVLQLSHSNETNSPASAVLLELAAHLRLRGPELQPPPPPPPAPSDDPLPAPSRRPATSLPSSTLIRFLLDPREAWMDALFGRPSSEDSEIVESFQWPLFVADRFLTDVFVRSWPESQDLPADAFPPPGTEGAPGGTFFRAERERLRGIFGRWQERLVEAALPRDPLQARAPGALDLEPRPGLRVELGVPATVESMDREHLVWPTTSPRLAWPRFRARAFVHHLIRNAVEPRATSALAVSGRGRVLRVRFAPLGPEESRCILGRWCRSLLEDDHDYHLPWSAADALAESVHRKEDPDSTRRRWERLAVAYGDHVPPFLDFERCLSTVRERHLQIRIAEVTA